MTAQKLITISQAAKRLGVSTKTLRRWEKSGKLLPQRTAGGHRRYDIESLRSIQFQRRFKKTRSSTISNIKPGTLISKSPNLPIAPKLPQITPVSSSTSPSFTPEDQKRSPLSPDDYRSIKHLFSPSKPVALLVALVIFTLILQASIQPVAHLISSLLPQPLLNQTSQFLSQYFPLKPQSDSDQNQDLAQILGASISSIKFVPSLLTTNKD